MRFDLTSPEEAGEVETEEVEPSAAPAEEDEPEDAIAHPLYAIVTRRNAGKGPAAIVFECSALMDSETEPMLTMERVIPIESIELAKAVKADLDKLIDVYEGPHADQMESVWLALESRSLD